MIAVGTCAWSYDDWRGVFYPEHLPPGDRLAFYAQHFPAVEIDSTFYHAPAAHVTAHWAEVTPPGFRFAAKVPREITHERKLRDCAGLVDEFTAGLAPLGEKLAAALLQLPPSFHVRHDESALRDFIRHLPDTVRWAVEFRDPAWHLPRIAHLLEEHRVCWAWGDVTPPERANEAAFGFWPHTTDFLYVRLLGDLEAKYRPDGSRRHIYRELQWPRTVALENWAEKIRALAAPASLVFAANHYEGFAPQTAARFCEVIGLPAQLPTHDELTGGDPRQMGLL